MRLFALDSEVYSNRHGRYCVPVHHDRPAVNTIKRGEVYERATLSYIAKALPKGSSVLHSGTYFSDMLSFYSRLVGKEGVVFAFKLVRLNYECAVETLQLNGLGNVELRCAALGDQQATLSMRTHWGGVSLRGGSIVVSGSRSGDSSEYEQVEAVRLDD